MPQSPPPANDGDPVEENEVLRAAREAREARERAEAGARHRHVAGWRTAAVAGIGIGSAALLAALLYANRDKD